MAEGKNGNMRKKFTTDPLLLMVKPYQDHKIYLKNGKE